MVHASELDALIVTKNLKFEDTDNLIISIKRFEFSNPVIGLPATKEDGEEQLKLGCTSFILKSDFSITQFKKALKK